MHRRGGVWRRIEVRTADDERNLDQHDIAHQIGDIDREDDGVNDGVNHGVNDREDDGVNHGVNDGDTWDW